MHNHRPAVSRRRFMLQGAGAAIGAGVLPAFAQSPPEVQALQPTDIVRRRLGRTEMQISHIVAAWDWREHLYADAVRLGINYWHKINWWSRIPEPLAKLDREAWYCDVTIDTLDEEGAIAQFEHALRTLGLPYFDSIKLHSIYNTVEDFKQKQGILRAFDRLKKQGKVKFLSAAQHGGHTAEICCALIESGHFDHLQPALSVQPTPAQMAMLRLAEKHDVGIIAKKVMHAVSRSKRDAKFRQWLQPKVGPDGKVGAAVIETVLSLPGVSAVTPLTQTYAQLVDNVQQGGPRLTQTGRRIAAAVHDVSADQCIYCGECLSACPHGLPVSDILRFVSYRQVYRRPRAAREHYQSLAAGQRADHCDQCGACERACPRGVPVRRRLREAHVLLA